MGKNNVAVALALFLSLVFVVSGCGGVVTEGVSYGEEYKEERPIKFAYSGPLTGEAASAGIANLRGIDLAVDKLNRKGGVLGFDVELLIEDDGFDPKRTLSAYQKLVSQDNVDIFFSTTYGGLLSVVPLADVDEVVIVDALDSSDELAAAGEYLFSIGIYDESYGYVIADFIFEKFRDANVGLVYNHNDPFTELIAESYLGKAEEYGLQTTLVQTYTFEDRDFRTMLAKAEQAGNEILIVIGYDEAGLLLRQAEEGGYDFTFLGFDNSGSEAFLRNAAGAAEGMYLTYLHVEDEERLEALVERYVEKYNEEPDQLLFTIFGYDAVMTVAKAMEDEDVRNGEGLKDALLRVDDYEGFGGTYVMDSDGAVRSIVEDMHVIKDGKPVLLEE